MKRVSIAEAKQTLPALVHEAEARGEIELTRRGKPVAYLVSAERYLRTTPSRGFMETFERWRAEHAAALGDEPLELARRQPARGASIVE